MIDDRRGLAANAMIPVVGVVIALMMFLVLGSQAGLNTSKNIDTLTNQAAKEIASEVSAVSAVGQGVRYYATGESFRIELWGDYVSVNYTDTQGKKSYAYSFPHIAKGVKPAVISGTGKICISKKLSGCKPEVTICAYPDGACCTLSKSTCVFAG